MARKGITYQQVAEVCEELRGSGQRISVRAIHAHTGGSLSTVLKHYRSWQEEQDGGGGRKDRISPQLQRALLAELEQAAARVRNGFAAQLAETNTRAAEGQARLAAAEQRLSDLQRRYEDLDAKYRESLQTCQIREAALSVARKELVELKNLRSKAAGPLEEQGQPSLIPQEAARTQKKPAGDRKSGKTAGEDEPLLFDF